MADVANPNQTGVEYLYPDTWTNLTDTGANYAAGFPDFINQQYQNWYNQPLSTGVTPYLQQTVNQAGTVNQPWIQGVQGAQATAGQAQPYYNQAGSALQPWGATIGSGLQALGGVDPYMQQAAQGYTAGSQYDQNQLQQYLNPYTQDAASAVTSALTQNLMENILPGVNSTFAGTGQFGSTRNADFTNRAIQNTQREAADAIAKANYGAYDQAHRAYSDWANKDMAAAQGMASLAGQQMNLAQGYGQLGSQYGALSGAYGNIGNAQQSLGNTLGSLAQTGSGMTQQQWQNMLTGGQTLQGLEQATLDKAYQDWTQRQQYPLAGLGALSTAIGNMSKGVLPNTNVPVNQPDDITRAITAMQAMSSGLNDESVQTLLSYIFGSDSNPFA